MIQRLDLFVLFRSYLVVILSVIGPTVAIVSPALGCDGPAEDCIRLVSYQGGLRPITGVNDGQCFTLDLYRNNYGRIPAGFSGIWQDTQLRENRALGKRTVYAFNESERHIVATFSVYSRGKYSNFELPIHARDCTVFGVVRQDIRYFVVDARYASSAVPYQSEAPSVVIQQRSNTPTDPNAGPTDTELPDLRGAWRLQWRNSEVTFNLIEFEGNIGFPAYDITSHTIPRYRPDSGTVAIGPDRFIERLLEPGIPSGPYISVEFRTQNDPPPRNTQFFFGIFHVTRDRMDNVHGWRGECWYVPILTEPPLKDGSSCFFVR